MGRVGMPVNLQKCIFICTPSFLWITNIFLAHKEHPQISSHGSQLPKYSQFGICTSISVPPHLTSVFFCHPTFFPSHLIVNTCSFWEKLLNLSKKLSLAILWVNLSPLAFCMPRYHLYPIVINNFCFFHLSTGMLGSMYRMCFYFSRHYVFSMAGSFSGVLFHCWTESIGLKCKPCDWHFGLLMVEKVITLCIFPGSLH